MLSQAQAETQARELARRRTRGDPETRSTELIAAGRGHVAFELQTVRKATANDARRTRYLRDVSDWWQMSERTLWPCRRRRRPRG